MAEALTRSLHDNRSKQQATDVVDALLSRSEELLRTLGLQETVVAVATTRGGKRFRCVPEVHEGDRVFRLRAR